MKRYIHILFACVCAIFSSTTIAQTLPEGTEVTISYTSGSTTYYLAVDKSQYGQGYSIVTVDEYSDACIWIQTANNAFYSKTAGQYLYYYYYYYLRLQDEPQAFQIDNTLYLTRASQGGGWQGQSGQATTNYYYLNFENNEFIVSNSENSLPTNLPTITIKEVSTQPTFTLNSPAAGTTAAFTEIQLTADAEIGELPFGPYQQDNNQKVKLTFTSADGTITTESYVLQGLTVTKPTTQTLQITIPENLGEGTYTLTIDEGAISSTAGDAFAAETYTWTVNAHTFGTVKPIAGSLAFGERLSEITVAASDDTPMTIADASKIELNDADNMPITFTAEVNSSNLLVITPVAPLGNGQYTLNIAKGAVKGPQNVNFNALSSQTWTVIATVSITHVPGFYSSLGAKGYQQVHTVERTIYYTGTETSVPLQLSETNFFGYMRWYNYDTDNADGITWATAPSSNSGSFTEVTGSTTHLGWFGWHSSKESGVLNASDDYPNKTPNIDISKWSGNHTIACDVSNYNDFDIKRIDEQIVSVTEPRLSYRQIFHFRPASEMAEKFAALQDDQYLEEYTYTAPINTNVYLATNYRYNGTIAENCYFYYDNNKTVQRVTNATWSGDGTITQSGAFGVVSSSTEGTKTYYLKSGDLRIAKFTVTYVDGAKYGPVQETTNNGITKALMSYAEMRANYEVLEYNNFSFGKTPTSSSKQYLTTPLPWNESTYGFYDGTTDIINSPGLDGIPYYGEYALVNYLPWAGTNETNNWMAVTANHVDGETNDNTAAAKGYALYVDGTNEPGVVASISTNVTICGQRTMYCSVWLRNPRGTDCGNSNVYKPIFRCNVQGRNKLSDGTYAAWEDVSVYFVGELGCVKGWTQINFPIVSQETYSECRVQIYNFGTGGNGNDLLLDDLCIYAEKLPMASYQLQTEMCCSPNHDGTTFTAAVLRVDYGANTLTDNTYQYYQIYNKTTKKPLVLSQSSLSPYYHEHQDVTVDGLTTDQYGSILVRPHDFDPSEESETIKNNPSELMSDLLAAYEQDKNKPLWGKCFVEKDPSEITSTSPGQYYMYIVHIIPNISGNRIDENYLQEHCDYTLRMTNSPDDLTKETLSCAVEIALPHTQQSLFRLMSEQIETTEFLCNSTNNCANDLYTLETFIRKDSDPYSDQGEAEGTYLADWMYGYDFDEVYRMDYPHTSDEAEDEAKNNADTQFVTAYDRTRQQVTDAFLDLRRPTDDNTNYAAQTFEQIDVTKFSDYNTDTNKDLPSKSAHYETIKYLHEHGWLQLRTSSVSFYLGSEATARYWVFPIENSAKAADGVTPLHDCPEPRWVEVSTKHSDYYLNVAPGIDVHSEQATDPRLCNTLPNVRVLARMVNNTIQIPVHQMSSDDYEIHFTGEDGFVYLTDDAAITNPQNLKYACSITNGVITLIPASGNTANLKIGKEYVMCVRMRNKDNGYPSADDPDCAVGKLFVRLLILPDVITWNPKNTDTQQHDAWQDDANWDGYGSGMTNYHYAPIVGSKVIINANGNYPELSIIDLDNGGTHPYPLDVNFALTPTCGEVYFASGAMMLNQHMLIHDKALVDLRVPNQTWNTIAVPVSGVVSGDMFIPHSGDEKSGKSEESTDQFTIKSFEGARHSESAYPFWLSVYNKTVQKVNENPAKTGTTISTHTKVFASTNSLVEPMTVGTGYQLLGFGPENHIGDLTIRLPKTDATYAYYYSNGTLGSNVSVTRAADAGKLIYSPKQTITLTNEQQSNSFMFGNPTMAMIDLANFIPDGAVVYQMINDGWVSETKEVLKSESSKLRYLAPMRSVMLQLPSASINYNISLETEHLTTGTTTATVATPIATRQPVTVEDELHIMSVYADVYGTKARCILASKAEANDVYALGEDAFFISSGVEAGVNSATATSPVNMYTVAKQVPLMVDVREHIDTVPLGLLIHDYYRTDKIILSFELSDNWTKECYFCDSETGTKTLIEDGLTLEVPMPVNHATRYYIQGPDRGANNGNGNNDIVSSTDDVQTDVQVWAYSPEAGQLVVATNDVLQAVAVYDLSGRLVASHEMALYYSSTTIQLPAGAYVLSATLRDGSVRQVSALVK